MMLLLLLLLRSRARASHSRYGVKRVPWRRQACSLAHFPSFAMARTTRWPTNATQQRRRRSVVGRQQCNAALWGKDTYQEGPRSLW